MIVACPSCQRQLRFNSSTENASRVTISCPQCAARFIAKSHQSPKVQLLIAHEDPSICTRVFDCLEPFRQNVQICRTTDEVAQYLQAEQPCLLLLDVAFCGSFPFELIQLARARADQVQHKILLLPSIYNRTAYKKKPDSLYGADAYLELHHIGDRLLPTVKELFPELDYPKAEGKQIPGVGLERELAATRLADQAAGMARLLVADIAFYHQREIEAGLKAGRQEELLAKPLTEGRRLLQKRLPAVAELDIDFVGQAFSDLCRCYHRTFNPSAEQERL